MSEKHEYRKRFYDLEKEEQWLNEMSEKGLALKSIDGGFFTDVYEFEPCIKKHIYRIDYNIEPTAYASDCQYVNFVNETYNAECIFYTGNKIYFRKAEEDGDFPRIYTNIESRLEAEKKQVRRVLYPVFLFLCSMIYSISALLDKKNIVITIFLAALCSICVFGLVFCIIRLIGHLKKFSALKAVQNEKGGE